MKIKGQCLFLVVLLTILLSINMCLCYAQQDVIYDADEAAVDIRFDHYYEEGNERAVITAVDNEGNILWEYESGVYPGAQLAMIKEIGQYHGNYYFCERGTIIAVNAKTGEEIWQNNEFGGSPSDWVFDERGDMYVCGSLGPFLFVVSSDGKTLARKATLIEEYFEPVKLELLTDNELEITFIGGPEYREEGFKVIVDFDDVEIEGERKKEIVDFYERTDDSENTFIAQTYSDIIERYKTALSESWDSEKLIKNDLCYLSIYDGIEEEGYSIMDINGDGIDELIIGTLREGGLNKGMFIDLYTMQEGKPVLVARSAERDQYFLCFDGIIANEASSSALTSHVAFYSLEPKKTELTFLEAVIYDGYYDEQNPWFYGTTSDFDVNSAVPITESDAFEIRNSYDYMVISGNPFSEYSS